MFPVSQGKRWQYSFQTVISTGSLAQAGLELPMFQELSRTSAPPASTFRVLGL